MISTGDFWLYIKAVTRENMEFMKKNNGNISIIPLYIVKDDMGVHVTINSTNNIITEQFCI